MTDAVIPGEGEHSAVDPADLEEMFAEDEVLSFQSFEPLLQAVVSERVGYEFRRGLPEGSMLQFTPKDLSDASGIARYSKSRLELTVRESGTNFSILDTDLDKYGEVYVRQTTGVITPRGLDDVSRGQLGKKPGALDMSDEHLEAEIFEQVSTMVDSPDYSLTLSLRE